MVRTQIQLPDELHARLKQAAEAREWSVAEIVRRAAEQYLETVPRRTHRERLPLPAFDLGPILASPDELREMANPEPEV